MRTSETFAALAAALAKAQPEMAKAKKDRENKHFGAAYATLASTADACLPALNKQDIAALQFPRLTSVGEDAWVVDVETMLLHKTGEFIADTVSVPVTKVDAQGVGSAITYARRYSLGAICGVAPEDDDGNAAVGPRDGASYAKDEPVVSTGERTEAPDDGKLYVVQVNSKSSGKSTTWSVHFSDGEKFVSKSDWVAALAEQLRANGTPCLRETQKTYLKGLTSDDQDDVAEAVPTVEAPADGEIVF